MPRKPLELPPAVARNFVRNMRAFFTEKNSIKKDGIAAGTLHMLKEHYPRQASHHRRARDVRANEGSRMKTVWVYINTAKEVGDEDHLKVFATEEAAEWWFAEHDPEGFAFEYSVSR